MSNSKDALFDKKIINPIINIEVFIDKNNVIIKVYDNANGINEDYIDNIFEPYFTTKENTKGTGLGLYMSKMIIEQNMNGELSVKNINNGACFTIILPLS